MTGSPVLAAWRCITWSVLGPPLCAHAVCCSISYVGTRDTVLKCLDLFLCNLPTRACFAPYSRQPSRREELECAMARCRAQPSARLLISRWGFASQEAVPVWAETHHAKPA